MTQLITIDTLRAIGATQEGAEKWLPHIQAACGIYEIDNRDRIAAFLATIGHESGGLRHTTEIWGPTPAQKTYEGRANLGNTQPGDGERFKGHGLIQTTGRYNHARVRDRLRARLGATVPDFEADPERLAETEWAALSAADYWDDRAINSLADAGDFEGVTRKVNGRLNGLSDRVERWDKVKKVLQLPAPEVPVVERSTIATATSRVLDFVNPAALAADTITPTPKEAPMAPFIAAVLPALVDLVPKLGKLFSSGSEVAERNIKAAELVVSVAKEAIGARNEQELLETIKADPQAAADVRTAIESQWFRIEEVGGGIAGAREANAVYLQPGAAGFWLNPAFWVSVGFLLMVVLILLDMLFFNRAVYDASLRTQIITAILSLLGMVSAYWLGTSFSSQRKTEIAAGTGKSV